MRKINQSIFWLIALAVLTAGCSGEKPLNVLLITLDTTRADHLGCYGYKEADTPVLDRLAKEGILYERAYCQVPLTLPSHTSILTGLQPPDHGIRLNGAYRLPGDIPTVAETLKEKGYDTAAFVSSFVLSSKFGLDRGFDVYEDSIIDSPDDYVTNPERPADETNRFAVSWLKNRQDSSGPFFAWVHYFDPHVPYNPPEPYSERFSENLYDGEIAFMDNTIGELLKVVDDDSTVVIVVADHGEGLGDHEEATHALFIYDSTIRVPLIVKLPESLASRYPEISPGERISRQVQTIDIVPTILELTNTNKGHEKILGRSLLEKEDEDNRICYAESLYPMSLGWSPLQSSRNREWKYIHAPEEELYRDSDEFTNKAQEKEEIVRQMKKLLRAFPVVSKSAEIEQEKLAPEVAENLRDLGYVSTGSMKYSTEELQQLPDPKNKVQVFDTINRARSFSNAERFQESVELLLPIYEKESENPEINNILGTAYIGLGQYEKGLQYLSRYNELAEGDLQAMFYLGVAHLRSGSPEKALEPLQECVRLMPLYSEAWDQLAVAYGTLGRYTQALEANKQAVEIEPFNPEYQKNLGVTYLRINDSQRAVEAFRKAVETRPEEPSYHLHLALALNRIGKFDQAVEQLKSTLQLEPENVEARERLIESYFRMGQKAEARTLAHQLEQEKRLGFVSAFYYGIMLLEEDRHEKAVQYLKQAIEGMPGYAPAYEALARGLIEKSDSQNAQWLQKKIEQNEVLLEPGLIKDLETTATGEEQ